MKKKRVFSILQAAGIAVLLLFASPVNAKTEKPDSVASVSKTPGHHEYQPPAEAIDLGLPSGTLWASYNIGATKPEEYGHYFAWGETEPKEKYDFFNDYKFFDINVTKGFTKYTNNDGKTELAPEDDAAYVKWGNGWRIPNYEQIIELYENCSFKQTSMNGVDGYIFVSNKNGKSIFFPYSGYYDGNQLKEANTVGYYWTQSLSRISTAGEDFAHTLYVSSSHTNMYVNHRYKGLTIRPVCSSNSQPEITSDSCLIVWHKDGSIAEFELQEKPKIIFLDNRVEVITSSLKVEYDFSAIEKMTYELKSTDAIPEIASDGASSPFVAEGGYIKFFSSKEDLNIRIFSLNGNLIKQHFVKRNESYSFPLYALPKGVYLIRVNNITNKVSIK